MIVCYLLSFKVKMDVEILLWISYSRKGESSGTI